MGDYVNLPLSGVTEKLKVLLHPKFGQKRDALLTTVNAIGLTRYLLIGNEKYLIS